MSDTTYTRPVVGGWEVGATSTVKLADSALAQLGTRSAQSKTHRSASLSPVFATEAEAAAWQAGFDAARNIGHDEGWADACEYHGLDKPE